MADASADKNEVEVLEGARECTLEELCVACQVEADWVAELVEHGALEPVGGSRVEWRFRSLTFTSVAKAKRLQRDLGLNVPGIALALDLLDQIDALQMRLKTYENDVRMRRLPL